jgi:hypothetical protein
LRTTTVVAIVISIVSLVVALTGPLWSHRLYGGRDAPSVQARGPDPVKSDPRAGEAKAAAEAKAAEARTAEARSADSARFLILGIAQLRPALESNEPFKSTLTFVKGVIPSEPKVTQALETLSSFADKGVPTLSELRARFAFMASTIVLDDLVSSGDAGGSFDRAVITLASAVQLHTLAHWLNDMRPSTEIVWQAQESVDAGDLPAAIAILGRLSGKDAEVAKPWIQEAQSRLAANQVLQTLDSLAQAKLASAQQR